jgi:cytoskeletal protein CcmA (bactofilin family)
MFSKTETTSAPARPATTAASGSNRSVFSADLRVTGEVSSSGTLEVLGEIDGNVTARGLIIGAEGRISGTVQSETIEVRGQLDGKVATQTFTLRAPARVAADVTYTSLVIESGATIEGHFARAKD